MRFMGCGVVAFVLLAIGGAEGVKATDCLFDDPILVCAISTHTGEFTDGKVKIINPTDCAVKVAFKFAADNTQQECTAGPPPTPCATGNDYTDPPVTVAANSTEVRYGAPLPYDCDESCDLPIGTCEKVTVTEATLTQGYYNGEWITYDTPCDTTPFSDNVCSDGDAGTCCEIPFGLTRPD